MISAGIWSLLFVALLAADARWLRVAQREHYEPLRLVAIAKIWCRVSPVNYGILGAGVAALTVGQKYHLATVVGLILLVTWPIGLSVTPTTAALSWTPRFRRLAVGVLLIQALLAVLAGRPEVAALLAGLVIPIIEFALLALDPVEKRLSSHFVFEARSKLDRIRPEIVGITGSYGKTSTKLYASHLVSGTRSTVSSPASFNNLMGLSRAVNDRLVPGTEVFIAEMGTYGPGEIRALCNVFRKSVV